LTEETVVVVNKGAKASATVPKFAEGWHPRLDAEFSKTYMTDLRKFLRQRKAQKTVIFPHSSNWFRSLQLTAFADVRVVIIGQDPYHGPGQAHGLSFSVPPGIRVPPSLANIYRELQSDLDIAPPQHGFLESWAEQGVLLLNSVLTVEQSDANSHQGRGWEMFTDRVIDVLNQDSELKAPHPSPLSAHRGFLGCKHFSLANQYLTEHSKGEIDWSSVSETA